MLKGRWRGECWMRILCDCENSLRDHFRSNVECFASNLFSSTVFVGKFYIFVCLSVCNWAHCSSQIPQQNNLQRIILENALNFRLSTIHQHLFWFYVVFLLRIKITNKFSPWHIRFISHTHPFVPFFVLPYLFCHIHKTRGEAFFVFDAISLRSSENENERIIFS